MTSPRPDPNVLRAFLTNLAMARRSAPNEDPYEVAYRTLAGLSAAQTRTILAYLLAEQLADR